MPENPTHEGLTAQGWNWSLQDAKSYVANYGKLNIGQMYITSDGKTRLYFTVTKNNNSVELYLDLASDTELDIDWGDESEHTRWTSDAGSSSQYHEYNSAGRYVIAIEVIAGEFYFSQILSDIYEMRIGNGVTSISDNTFYDHDKLLSITIPNSVTSIGENAFNSCHALSLITIPNSVTSIGDYSFSDVYASLSITIPNSITSIGNYCFSGYSALSSITIPDSITSIGAGSFSGNYALLSITFKSLTPPELGGSFGISASCIIRVPQGSLEAYTTAKYYPDPKSCIYEEY